MDHHNENHHDHPGNGFLLGLIIGGVATLLFTTKKGREIVKDFVDKSLEKYSDLEKSVERAEKDYEDVIDGEDYLEPVEGEKLKLAKEAKSENSSHKHFSQNPHHQKGKTTYHRFFKGSKKG